ncbi:MAG: VWA domain-containing protein [Akkermansiaceae bacterium]
MKIKPNPLLTTITSLLILATNLIAQQPADPPANNPNTLTLTAKTQKPLISSTEKHAYVLLRLSSAKSNAPQAHKKLNLSLVIDRSGSMSGQKIIDARNSAIQMLKQMRDGDTVSVVSYSNDFTVNVEPTVINEITRNKIEAIIHTISDGGGTNLSEGMINGINCVTKNKDKAQVNRVLLISDGNANAGIKDPAKLNKIAREALQNGIVITTLGLGVDYNEDLMTGIADNGGGNYYFIEESNKITETLNQEISQMASTVGKDLQLKTSIPQGMKLDKVYGWIAQHQAQAVRVPLGEIFSGQTRAILCRINFPAQLQNGQQLTLPPFTLDYKQLNGEQELPVTLKTQPLTITVSDDQQLILGQQNMEVTARIAEIELANRLENAAKLVEQRKFDDAKKELLQAVQQAKTSAAKIPDEWKKQLNEVTKEAEKMAGDIDKAEKSAYERKKWSKGGKASQRKYSK